METCHSMEPVEGFASAKEEALWGKYYGKLVKYRIEFEKAEAVGDVVRMEQLRGKSENVTKSMMNKLNRLKEKEAKKARKATMKSEKKLQIPWLGKDFRKRSEGKIDCESDNSDKFAGHLVPVIDTFVLDCGDYSSNDQTSMHTRIESSSSSKSFMSVSSSTFSTCSCDSTSELSPMRGRQDRADRHSFNSQKSGLSTSTVKSDNYMTLVRPSSTHLRGRSMDSSHSFEDAILISCSDPMKVDERDIPDGAHGKEGPSCRAVPSVSDLKVEGSLTSCATPPSSTPCVLLDTDDEGEDDI
eukprot:Nk52_evm48s223 gene=Nk52_evmTU48s223